MLPNTLRAMYNFMDVLHEVPAVLNALPPEALKGLSATCRGLRASFCAQVSVIYLAVATDASKLCCTTWPQLMLVVCTSQELLNSKLSPQWHFMMEIKVVCDDSTTAALIRPYQQLLGPLIDLPSQHYNVLADFVEMHRLETTMLTLQGPLVGCSTVQFLTRDLWPAVTRLKVIASPQLRVETLSHLCDSLQFLTHIIILDTPVDALALLRLGTAWPYLQGVKLGNNQLDADAISAIAQVKWPWLRHFILKSNLLGVAGMQHVVSCSWPQLCHLCLQDVGMNAPDVHCLTQGQWPVLQYLCLDGNNIDATGISYLVQGSWPLLCRLNLSIASQGLDEEAYSKLGISDKDISEMMHEHRFGVKPSKNSLVYDGNSHLLQFPDLQLKIFHS